MVNRVHSYPTQQTDSRSHARRHTAPAEKSRSHKTSTVARLQKLVAENPDASFLSEANRKLTAYELLKDIEHLISEKNRLNDGGFFGMHTSKTNFKIEELEDAIADKKAQLPDWLQKDFLKKSKSTRERLFALKEEMRELLSTIDVRSTNTETSHQSPRVTRYRVRANFENTLTAEIPDPDTSNTEPAVGARQRRPTFPYPNIRMTEQMAMPDEPVIGTERSTFDAFNARGMEKEAPSPDISNTEPVVSTEQTAPTFSYPNVSGMRESFQNTEPSAPNVRSAKEKEKAASSPDTSDTEPVVSTEQTEPTFSYPNVRGMRESLAPESGPSQGKPAQGTSAPQGKNVGSTRTETKAAPVSVDPNSIFFSTDSNKFVTHLTNLEKEKAYYEMLSDNGLMPWAALEAGYEKLKAHWESKSNSDANAKIILDKIDLAYKRLKDKTTRADCASAFLEKIDNQPYSLFKTLGLSKTATPAEIKKSFRALSLEWHSDKNQNIKEQAEEIFQAVNLANETLGDDTKRTTYLTDSRLRARPHANGPWPQQPGYASHAWSGPWTPRYASAGGMPRTGTFPGPGQYPDGNYGNQYPEFAYDSFASRVPRAHTFSHQGQPYRNKPFDDAPDYANLHSRFERDVPGSARRRQSHTAPAGNTIPLEDLVKGDGEPTPIPGFQRVGIDAYVHIKTRKAVDAHTLTFLTAEYDGKYYHVDWQGDLVNRKTGKSIGINYFHPESEFESDSSDDDSYRRSGARRRR
jgi:curved DNA-binding protein CbpA